MKIKPYQLVLVTPRPNFPNWTYIGEVMSFETPDHTAMVRRVPGHPGTLEEIPVSQLAQPSRKMNWVHYARIDGPRIGEPLSRPVPVDMLRYDSAAPVNFDLRDINDREDMPELDMTFGWDHLVIAKCTPTRDPQWTFARWSSFMWACNHLKSENLGTTRSYI